MDARENLRQRLAAQHLLTPRHTRAADVVAMFGAVQAQDFYGAKWALGQRMMHATDAALDDAFNAGEILRTHVLRPTWHFVTPQDIRWLLELTAPRVHAVNAFMYRNLELDDALFRRSENIFTRTLRNGKSSTREELGAALQRAGIAGVGQRLAYLIMHAELEGVLCSGARRGKQFTYALLGERAPRANKLQRAEALRELTRRYFGTRGPATARDFVWWSGLTMRDAQRGIASCKSELAQETFEDQVYWFVPSNHPALPKSPRAHLLPNYDEYFIGLRDRSSLMDTAVTITLDARENILSNHLVFFEGRLVGGWWRSVLKDTVEVRTKWLRPLTVRAQREVSRAARQYADFMELQLKYKPDNNEKPASE